jgi:hypothetical protein
MSCVRNAGIWRTKESSFIFTTHILKVMAFITIGKDHNARGKLRNFLLVPREVRHLPLPI